MLVLYEDTRGLFREESLKVDMLKDINSVDNKIYTKPKGVIISDTYNHFAYPIRPKPVFDTHKLDLIDVSKTFRSIYGPTNHLMFPWHFTVELFMDSYIVFNTRPIDMKFPLTNKDIKNTPGIELDDSSKNFLDTSGVDISECIHVVIIGDTNRDVYTMKTYEVISRFCISPFFRYFRIPAGFYQRTFFFNIGKKFNKELLTKFNKR
jgi:hypothetical protein